MAYKKIFLALDDSPQMDYVFERAREEAEFLEKTRCVLNSGKIKRGKLTSSVVTLTPFTSESIITFA